MSWKLVYRQAGCVTAMCSFYTKTWTGDIEVLNIPTFNAFTNQDYEDEGCFDTLSGIMF
jgi:hypothetical protein